MTPTNYNELVQMLSLVDPALFHGRRATVMPDMVRPEPRMTPVDREEPLPFMAPVTPYAPPPPTRKPSPPPEITEPRGGYGKSGPASGAELERRIAAEPSSNPFVGKGTDYSKGLWPWQRQYWDELRKNASDIYNAPKPAGHEEAMIALSLLPVGRLAAPIKMGAKALAERQGLEKLQDVLETGYRKAWYRGAGIPPAPKPLGPRETFTESLQKIHGRVRRENAKAPRPVKYIPEYSAADKARVQRAAKARRNDIARQLHEKGILDSRTRRLLELE